MYCIFHFMLMLEFKKILTQIFLSQAQTCCCILVTEPGPGPEWGQGRRGLGGLGACLATRAWSPVTCLAPL